MSRTVSHTVHEVLRGKKPLKLKYKGRLGSFTRLHFELRTSEKLSFQEEDSKEERERERETPGKTLFFVFSPPPGGGPHVCA